MKYKINKKIVKLNTKDENIEPQKIVKELLENKLVYIFHENLDIKSILENFEKYNIPNVSFVLKLNTDLIAEKEIKKLIAEFENLPIEYFLYFEKNEEKFYKIMNNFISNFKKELEEKTDVPFVLYPFFNIVLKSLEVNDYNILINDNKKLLKFVNDFKYLKELKRIVLREDFNEKS